MGSAWTIERVENQKFNLFLIFSEETKNSEKSMKKKRKLEKKKEKKKELKGLMSMDFLSINKFRTQIKSSSKKKLQLLTVKWGRIP